MDLYNSIIVAIWLCVAYAIWAATAAGDPGYGQVAFLFGGIFAHLYLRKIKLERPISKNDEITIPDADFSVEIPDEGDKYYFSEKSYRKIIWISTIISLILISIFASVVLPIPGGPARRRLGISPLFRNSLKVFLIPSGRIQSSIVLGLYFSTQIKSLMI